MPNANIRAGRVNKSVAHELEDILRSVKDPRVAENYVTINSAEVTRDLKTAKVFFGCITGSPDEVKKGLESAKGFLRTELARRLNMRQTPDLTFHFDNGAERGARIAEILGKLDIKNQPEETEDNKD